MTTAVNADTSAAEPTSAPAQPTSGGDAADVIRTLRGQIDALDEAIIALVKERTQVSRHIQAVRINDGGTRVELGRERQILDAYANGLGRDGMQLADAILQIGRGQQGNQSQR